MNYKKTLQQLKTELNTNLESGLSQAEAQTRLEKHGLNFIDLSEKQNLFKLFIEQLNNPIVLLLIGAVSIAFITGQVVEAILILAIVIFMAIFGVYLESKAGDAVDKLKNLSSTQTTVIREGRSTLVDSKTITLGDLIFLQEGDKVPADLRIIHSNDLQVNEAILTGESVPVSKNNDDIVNDVGIGDQSNMLFSGTFVVQGNARAIVVSVGINTELGNIAQKLAEAEAKQTPLQEQLEKLSKVMLIGTLIFCGIVLGLSIYRGQTLLDAAIQSLSLAVAFIPEGLSAVMTVTLAIGVNEMVKKKVIIKRLMAAEGLGSVSLLATDKTGTITTGEMTVEKLWLADHEIDPKEFRAVNNIEQKIVDIIKFCNNSKGATERALVNFVESKGLEFEIETRELEHRFSSAFKRMMVIAKKDNKLHGYAKGAPDVLIPLCQKYIDNDGSEKEFSVEKKAEVLEEVNSYAADGYRVLCLAFREFGQDHQIGQREKDEDCLVFLCLIGLIDPIREEVNETVKEFFRAGIRPVMITGDHKEIAKTIALQAGIIKDKSERVITGNELDDYFNGNSNLSLSDVANCKVFARVSPEHKNRLVDIFKKEGFITAMAGDGVNDAVAIAKSDIGIAVREASDIVKESADVVVTGNYGALANAIETGRLIIFRTRLYLHYLLSGNFCQVGVFMLCLAFNYPAPLTALSLLLINVLTDAAPAMSMAFEKGDRGLMDQPPRKKDEGIISNFIWRSIAFQGLISSIFLFLVFYFVYDNSESNLALAQTATFTAYMAQKLMRGFTARSFTRSVFDYGFFSNKYILFSVIFAIAVWFLAIFPLRELFEFQEIEANLLLKILLAAIILPMLEEIVKKFNAK